MAVKGLRRTSSKTSPFYAANQVDNASMVVGAKIGSTKNVAVTLLDPDGNALQQSGSVNGYLATLPTGLVLPSAPSGGAVIGTNGLAIVQVTSLAWKFVSNAAGLFDLTITDSGTPLLYLILVMPSGNIVASGAIQF